MSRRVEETLTKALTPNKKVVFVYGRTDLNPVGDLFPSFTILDEEDTDGDTP